jgi:hypothetical protein
VIGLDFAAFVIDIDFVDINFNDIDSANRPVASTGPKGTG